MDVTSSNFGEAIKIIQKLLPITQYIAFDLEFSGLRFQNFQRDHINHLPYEKYKKLKYVAETYQILQLGLTFVTYEAKLKAYPFNFYLFPRNPIFYDKNISLQLGCVKFNTDCGMDWNKWIRQGINYIQLSEMEQLQRQEKNKSSKVMLENLSIENENSVLMFLMDVDRIAKGAEKQTVMHKLTYSSYKLLSTIFYKYIQEKNLSVSIQYIPGKSADDDDYIAIKKINKNERAEEASERKLQLYGFALLFQKIWKSKKTIVGHNCFLDLLYLYQGLVGRLPQNYFDFKKALSSSGNTFYDTKYIALKYPDIFGTDTNLENVCKAIKQKYPNKLIKLVSQKEFNRYSQQNAKFHEAGFDSYITGWLFMQMQKLSDEIDRCKNLININFSFFRINLERDLDEINPYYAQNLLRINLEIDDKEDVKKKRTEVVKKIKEHLLEINNSRAYHIHEGYREIFIEIKENKRAILNVLAKIKAKRVVSDIKTFAGYLQWQEERTKKAAISEYYRQKKYKNEEKKYNKQGGQWKEESMSEKSQKGQEHRPGRK